MKYAGIWILVAIAVAILGAFPRTQFWLAALVGVGYPSNLLFALVFVILFTVRSKLSSELSSLQGESPILAEEIAFLRLELRTLPRCASPKDEVSGGSESGDLST